MQARKMVRCAAFSALICLCAWLSVPFGDISFTLQTFGVFLALGLLGGKWGSAAIGVYLLLGAVGLPVFSGFRGGLGMLLGTTGGYLLGFLFSGLGYWLVNALWKRTLPALLVGQVCCYLFGSLWYYYLYASGGGLGLILMKCVVPYLLPDLIKLALALFLIKKLRRFVY